MIFNTLKIIFGHTIHWWHKIFNDIETFPFKSESHVHPTAVPSDFCPLSISVQFKPRTVWVLVALASPPIAFSGLGQLLCPRPRLTPAKPFPLLLYPHTCMGMHTHAHTCTCTHMHMHTHMHTHLVFSGQKTEETLKLSNNLWLQVLSAFLSCHMSEAETHKAEMGWGVRGKAKYFYFNKFFHTAL